MAFEDDIIAALNPPVPVVAPPPPTGGDPIIVQGEAPVIHDFIGAAMQQAQPPTPAPVDELLATPIADPDAAPGMGREATDRSIGRINDMADRKTGGKKEDGVLVQEETESQSGAMSPEARAAHAEAKGREIEQTYIASQLKQGLERKQQAAELEALQASQAQFERLGKVRDAELQNARTVRDRMNVISNEIAREAENPASEGLFAGQSAGGAMIRAIGLALIAAGAGMRARGGDMSGAEQAIQTIRDVSMQEVRRQARVLQLKQGAHDALGTIAERHMANLQDAELATKATEADLMRIALVKAKQYAVDAAPVIGAAETKLLLARLEQEAIVAGADLNRLYGEKLHQKITTKYTMPRRVLQQNAGRSPVAQPDAMVPPLQGAPVDPIEQYFAGLDQQATPIDPAVAEATGMVPPQAPAAPRQVPVAAGPTGPAPGPGISPAPVATGTAVAQPGQQAPSSQQAPAPAAKAGQGWSDLLMAGKYEEAWHAMPQAQRDFFRQARDKRMKDDERFANNRNAAMVNALDTWRDQNTPNKPLSAKEEERVLVSNGQRYRLRVAGGEAEKVRNAVVAADRLVAKYQRVLQIAGKYNGSFDAIPPKLRGEVKTLATQIAALSSQAFEMGVIQKWDAELWKDMSGERLAEWITDPRSDFGAAARTAAQEAMRDRVTRLKAYADAENDRPMEPRTVPK